MNTSDIQRAALRELVQLSAESSAAEKEIDRVHQVQTYQADRQLEKTLAQIEEKHQSERSAVEDEYQRRVSATAQETATAMADVESQSAALKEQLEYDSDSVAQEIKSKFQQSVWLAESVYEATQNQIVVEIKKAKDDHVARGLELDEITSEALSLLALYGQRELATTIRPEPPAADAPRQTYEACRDRVKQDLAKLQTLQVPRLFVGVRPVLVVAVICIVPALITHLIANRGVFSSTPHFTAVGSALGASVMICVIAGVLLRMVSKSHVRAAYIPLRQGLEDARIASDQALEDAKFKRDKAIAHATKKRDLEVLAARDKSAPMQARASKHRESALTLHQADHIRRINKIQDRRNQLQAEADEWYQQNLTTINDTRQKAIDSAQQERNRIVRESQQKYDQGHVELEQRWNTGLARIQRPIEQDARGDGSQTLLDWDDPKWRHWAPPRKFPPRVRFGELQVDLKQITDQYPRNLELPPTFSVPGTLVFPRMGSMLIQTDHAGRSDAIRIQQMVMARLLTQLPPGRVRFTIIDPVALGQNFAGFMHLADHDEALVGSRIWTESEHIEQQLANLTEHMETVIQKYLRNEFETIDDYNAQAGELAEPYRYLVIADFPVRFEGDAFRRLNSIATSGARCGVFTLVVRDTRHPLPSGAHMDELEAHSINLVRQGDRFVWKDEIFKQFPLEVDPPPGEEFLTKILDVVGQKAKEAKRVEVAFSSIAPADNQIWSADSSSELQVPIGRLGATRHQMLKLGRGVAQHALIAGKTGSGKSTLLHVLVTNLALWYAPDQVEFYLVDFKKGVEFKTYATHALPHARAIAVESDREFGLSVLQRIDAELTRRGEIFRKLGVQDLAGYRDAQKRSAPAEINRDGSYLFPILPRTLLIIDEFQEFFSEDDKLSQEAALLLDRLVRQGRAFGIHVLLGSQTIGGTSGLARSTIGQMAVRIALQTSEADSQLILGDTNSAARLLSRPGEAIYNDAGGLVEGNSPFQISWLPEEDREIWLDRVRKRAIQNPARLPEAIVFEGNAPADITRNRKLARLLETPAASKPSAPLIWLGDPVAIKEPTAIALRSQSGANVLMVGQHDEPAMALMASSMISLAAQHPPKTATFYLLDGTPADSSLAGMLPRIAAALPVQTHNVEWRSVNDVIAEIAAEVQSRMAAERHDHPSIYVFIYGLQRYRALRKSEESYSFSTDESEKKPQPDKQLAEILREGPGVGVHVISWIDTAASIERTFDRGALREFDNRVLFQMSAADSSNLIDSPMGNKLGFHRALAFSEELGVMEKFRPYAVPGKNWLDDIRQKLSR